MLLDRTNAIANPCEWQGFICVLGSLNVTVFVYDVTHGHAQLTDQTWEGYK